jgi:hypothetical protein
VTAGTRALLLALRNIQGDWTYNPPPDAPVMEHATLVLMGTPDDLERIRKTVRPSALGARTEEAKR